MANRVYSIGMAFGTLVEFRTTVERVVCESRRRGNKRNLIYLETRYESFEIPFIYIYIPLAICVYDFLPLKLVLSVIHAYILPLLRWCRAGFRGAPPLEEFEDDVSGFGEVSIVCESLTRRLRKRVQRVQVEVVKAGWSHQRNALIEHDGVVSMGILALGQHCVRVVVNGKESPLVCP